MRCIQQQGEGLIMSRIVEFKQYYSDQTVTQNAIFYEEWEHFKAVHRV